MNTFDPNTHIQTITIVGLGGTGSQVARSVARMVYDMKAAQLHPPTLRLVDPDKVSAKNVGRQLYMLCGIHYESEQKRPCWREGWCCRERNRMESLPACCV